MNRTKGEKKFAVGDKERAACSLLLSRISPEKAAKICLLVYCPDIEFVGFIVIIKKEIIIRILSKSID